MSGIRYNRTALRYKRLYRVKSRVVVSHPGELDSNGSIFMGPLQKHS